MNGIEYVREEGMRREGRVSVDVGGYQKEEEG